MERLGRLAGRQAILVGGIVVLLGLGLFGLAHWQLIPRAQAQEYAAAQSRWAGRPFSHYRLVIDFQIDTLAGSRHCAQVTEIEGEIVTKVYQNTCNFPAWTVTDLFKLIGLTRSTPCVSHACACDLVVAMQASYHARLGYPSTIALQWWAQANWLHPQYWKLVLSTGRQPVCASAAGPRGSRISVVSLTPLP
jgi:hypothetical protein